MTILEIIIQWIPAFAGMTIEKIGAGCDWLFKNENSPAWWSAFGTIAATLTALYFSRDAKKTKIYALLSFASVMDKYVRYDITKYTSDYGTHPIAGHFAIDIYNKSDFPVFLQSNMYFYVPKALNFPIVKLFFSYNFDLRMITWQVHKQLIPNEKIQINLLSNTQDFDKIQKTLESTIQKSILPRYFFKKAVIYLIDTKNKKLAVDGFFEPLQIIDPLKDLKHGQA